MRALYQRKKGRDLLDLWLGLSKFNLDHVKLASMFEDYLAREGLSISQLDYQNNLDNKMQDRKFMTDTNALLAADFSWDINKAHHLVKSNLIALLSS